MSLSLDSTASARAASVVRGVHWLVELDFTTGTLYFTTWPHDIEAQGHTYTALGSLLSVSAVGESENTAAEKITLSLSVVNTSMLAATLGNVDTYRGRAVRLYLQFIDDTFQPAGETFHYWTGTMEPVKVVRTVSEDGSTGRIELPCSRGGMARSRNAEGLRLSDAQQQATYSGDKGYEYITTLIEQPTLWLSKRFQAIE